MEGSLSLSLVGWRLLALASVSSGFIGQNWGRTTESETESESESAQAPNTTGCIRREPEERLGTRQTVRLLDGRG